MTKKPKVPWSQAEVDRRFTEMIGDDADQSASARKRRRILRAAYELFLTHGYRKTNLDDIARKAEVAKGTVYLYFENKGQLLIHAVALEKSKLRDRTKALFDGSLKGGERLHYWIEMAVSAPKEMPLVARLLAGDAELFAALEDAGHQELETRMDEGIDFVVSLIEDAVPGRLDEAEKRRRAETIISLGLVSGKLVEHLHGARTVPELAKTLADLVLYGVGGKKV
jgi:AcrR family transcriptional regulator